MRRQLVCRMRSLSTANQGQKLTAALEYENLQKGSQR